MTPKSDRCPTCAVERGLLADGLARIARGLERLADGRVFDEEPALERENRRLRIELDVAERRRREALEKYAGLCRKIIELPPTRRAKPGSPLEALVREALPGMLADADWTLLLDTPAEKQGGGTAPAEGVDSG